MGDPGRLGRADARYARRFLRTHPPIGMSADTPLDPALYLVATPIGNLGDLTQRASHVLKEAGFLYAEDTRHSRRLLSHLGIERPMQPCHEHNEEKVAADIISRLRSGNSCALISDAGTPGISDPGFRLVRACRKAGLPVIPVPGASAVLAALSVSGLPTDSFRFYGFLPPKRAARLRHFQSVADSSETLIYFESTHRIGKFLEDAMAVFGGDRCMCLARELTKQYETVLSGSLSEVAKAFAPLSSKGEFVVLFAKEGYSL